MDMPVPGLHQETVDLLVGTSRKLLLSVSNDVLSVCKAISTHRPCMQVVPSRKTCLGRMCIRRPIGTGVTNLCGGGFGFVSGIHRPQSPVRAAVASW